MRNIILMNKNIKMIVLLLSRIMLRFFNLLYYFKLNL